VAVAWYSRSIGAAVGNIIAAIITAQATTKVRSASHDQPVPDIPAMLASAMSSITMPGMSAIGSFTAGASAAPRTATPIGMSIVPAW
jgi:hypothetical protein